MPDLLGGQGLVLRHGQSHKWFFGIPWPSLGRWLLLSVGGAGLGCLRLLGSQAEKPWAFLRWEEATGLPVLPARLQQNETPSACLFCARAVPQGVGVGG